MLIEPPNIVGWTFPVSRIQSTSFTLMRYVNAWWLELGFEGMQRQHLQSPRFVDWLSLEIFELSACNRKDFYTPVPNGWHLISNCGLGVSMPVTLLYFAHNLNVSGSRVRWHDGGMAKVALELTTLCTFLWTVCDGVVNRLETESMIRVGGNDVVLVCVFHGTIRQ